MVPPPRELTPVSYINLAFVQFQEKRDSGEEEFQNLLSKKAREWSVRTKQLSIEFVGAIHVISQEFLLWLKSHPNALEKIAWDAFEKVVAEIFASKGFTVDLTGRLRNKSADLIAIKKDEFGIETKYLVECKKYSSENRIGLDLVNGVIGAAKRANTEHAFLVTTSSFTKDVLARKAELEDIRLHLRDGQAVQEWLQNYRSREDGSLWLATGWNESVGLGDRIRNGLV